MLLVHWFLTLLMIFPLFSLLGGDLRQAGFLVWWAIGTAGLSVLVYSAATFEPRRKLAGRQIAGLLAGILATLPLVFGFAGDWGIAASAVLALCTAGYILVCTARPSESAGGDL
jgi:FtsH-binding integral membrane protein